MRPLVRYPAATCPCFPRAGEFGTARGVERPTQGSCARGTRLQTRVDSLCSPLGGPVPTTAQVRACRWPRKWALGLLGAIGGGLACWGGWGGFGLHHVPLPLLQHPIPPPLVQHHLPTLLLLDPPPVASLSRWLSLSFPSPPSPSLPTSPCAPAASERSCRLTPLPLDLARELSLVVVVVVVVELHLLQLLELLQLAGTVPCGTSEEKKQKILIFRIVK